MFRYYLAKSIAEKGFRRLATRSNFFKEVPLPNRCVAPGTHSETGASEPRRDRLDTNRRSTGLCPYEIRSNPLGLSRNDFNADALLAARLVAVNAESCMWLFIDGH